MPDKKNNIPVNNVKLDTISYHFVPFVYNNSKNNLISVKLTSDWALKNPELKYFMSFVSEKLDSTNQKLCCTKRYDLSDNGFCRLHLPTKKDSIFLHASKGNPSGEPFSLKLQEIYLYLFDTNIGILVYRFLHPKDESYRHLSTKFYHLKKIGTAKLSRSKDEIVSLLDIGNCSGNSFLSRSSKTTFPSSISSLYDLSNYILSKSGIVSPVLCFNTFPQEARCNFMVHFCDSIPGEIKPYQQERVKKILFYLKRGYYANWTYDKDSEDANDVYSPSAFIHWGISSEGVACVSVTDIKTNFVQNGFWTNFQTQYLTLAIITYHQKMALYYYINKMSSRKKKTSYEVSRFLNEFALFRAHHMFDIISESKTYQTVYTRMKDAYGIDLLYGDLKDQVGRLYEAEQIMNNRVNQIKDSRLSLVLALLSFSCIFSALVDAKQAVYDVCTMFGIAENYIDYIQRNATIGLLIISFILIVIYLLNHFTHKK